MTEPNNYNFLTPAIEKNKSKALPPNHSELNYKAETAFVSTSKKPEPPPKQKKTPKPTKKKPKPQIRERKWVSIEEDTHAKIKARAKERHLSLGELVDEILTGYIKSQDRDVTSG